MQTSVRSVRFRHLLTFTAVMGVVSAGVGIAAAATPGAQLWTKRYNGPANGDDKAWSVVVSPDGATVYATGYSYGGSTTGYDIATVAYDPDAGSLLWEKRYNSRNNLDDAAYSIAVSPDGTKVYVTGYSDGGFSTTFLDYTTVAYEALTGAKIWAKHYNGPGSARDDASSVAVSPDGSMVFVTGESTGSTSGFDYATLAYDATTGEKLWVKRYNGPGNGSDYAYSVVVSPDGTKVFVIGQSAGSTNPDYATVAYDASNGTELWAKRYKGPDNRFDDADAVVVSPDGTSVFVTGGSSDYTSGYDYATISYDSTTGAKQWVTRYNGPANFDDAARALAVSGDGTKIFVTGVSVGSGGYSDYATLAYSASTGAELWAKRYNGPGDAQDFAHSVAVGPDGTKVYVTGESTGATSGYDYATLAYDSSTGTRVWVRRYDGSGNGSDFARRVAVSPDGTKVFVTGESTGSTSGSDYLTRAYTA